MSGPHRFRSIFSYQSFIRKNEASEYRFKNIFFAMVTAAADAVPAADGRDEDNSFEGDPQFRTLGRRRGRRS